MLCLLDTRASHNFITRESVERMELHLEELKAIIEVHFMNGVPPSHYIISDRSASSIRKLERKSGLVGSHLDWNGLHFWNGIHHPKQCAHRRAQ